MEQGSPREDVSGRCWHAKRGLTRVPRGRCAGAIAVTRPLRGIAQSLQAVRAGRTAHNGGITALPASYPGRRTTPRTDPSSEPPGKATTLRNTNDSRAASHHHRRLRIVAAAAGCALAIAACGSASPTDSGSGLTANSKKAGALAFAKCMRSHGVANFPDPQVTGNSIQILGPNSGINVRSPAFQSAQTSCKHLLPGGGPGSGPPSPQAHAHLLQISECMRRHGISSFPDPQTGSPPSNPNGYSAILGHGGYFLAIPSSIDTTAPAFKQAAIACKFGGPPGR